MIANKENVQEESDISNVSFIDSLWKMLFKDHKESTNILLCKYNLLRNTSNSSDV